MTKVGEGMDELASVFVSVRSQLQASGESVRRALSRHPYWKRERTLHTCHRLILQSVDAILVELNETDIHDAPPPPSLLPLTENFSDILQRERDIIAGCMMSLWCALDAPPYYDWAREEQHHLLVRWLALDNCARRMLEDLPPDARFCCEQKCFFGPTDDEEEEEAIVCRECRARDFCKCSCVMYAKFRQDTRCCSLGCIEPTLGTCLLCPGACVCACVTQQQARNLLFLRDEENEDETIVTRVNGQVLELVRYRGNETHCCAKKCFSVPVRMFRGRACTQCLAMNFCKCACVTWNSGSSPRLFEPLVKPSGGWETASEKDQRPWQANVSFHEKVCAHFSSVPYRSLK